ncbi:low-density lipoprotein receptor-related protein 4-like [Saccostrea echinata]|uniref:low-density lipoprotein receptor-related protein 4-like n=1 Tax=Saccostrea echinata TaxID=191078 RepID=UPI002A7EB725|nr:low-density lipoprotein receptor-related protein 4-like [Saccostrea echinata]
MVRARSLKLQQRGPSLTNVANSQSQNGDKAGHPVVENLDSISSKSGIPGDKGLIIGMWDPASIFTVTEIPRSPANYYNNVSKSLTPSSVQLTSISSDPNKNIVFASIRDSIYAFQNFTIWQNKSSSFSLAFKGKSIALGQIAFDYVSNNLYWCDSLLNWIAMKPAYMDNNTIYKIVAYQDLKQPEGITLDPEDGLMFFSDNDPNSRIEKASMDGTNRSVIVHTGLIRVLALSVDAANNLLYWADIGRHTLEVSNYDGSNRRVLRRNNNAQVTGLHYNQNMLHVVSAGSRVLFGVDTISGSQLYFVKVTEAQPFTVHVYDAEVSKTYTDPCSTRSCQHMCVNTPLGATCLCAEGYQLSSDGMTCTDRSWFYEKGFIVSNATVFFMLDVHSVNGRQDKVNYFQISSANIETFAVDSNLHIIYFVDSRSNTLKELSIFTEQTRTLASVSNARDLVFDWIANLLGWIDTSQSNIQAFTINSGTISTIYSGLEQPVSLTVDAHNGYLFWISGTSAKSILRGNWNRNVHRTIVSSANLNNPSSLHYDVTTHRIFWLDNSLIKSSMVNGSDIKTYSVITFGATRAFVYKDFFGWTRENTIYFARKAASTAEYSITLVPNMKGVAVFDSSLQQDEKGTCHFLNGGCEDICVPLQSGRKCQCDLGLKLQTDLTCDSDIYTTNFIVVTDFSHGRILQIDLNTGNVTKLPIIIQKTPAIMLDKSTMELYFSDISAKTIMSTTLHGQNKTLVYSTGFAYADRMAIDYSTGNIYYTAVGSTTSQSYIGVVKRFNLVHKTLLSNLHSPREIVVYPSKGFMYWTEFGNITQIGRSYMDGTSKFYIATNDIGWPNGLAIDFETNRLYWTDGLMNRIEYSDLNGGNRHVLTTDNDAHLMSIAILGQHLFYTAWNRQRITKMDKSTGSKITFMSKHPELGRLDSLAIFADDRVDVNSICSKKNGNCSTFCFPTPSGRTCGCQDNVNLQSDQTTCQGVSRCPTSLPNVNFLNCLPYPGQTCTIDCKPGYRPASNMSITCDNVGQWVPSPFSLCTETLCPSSIDNAVVSSSCSRRVGESCEITCSQSNISYSLLCTTEGTWSQDTRTICLSSGCSKTILNGNLISCQANIGDICRYECTSPFRKNPSVSNITCNSNGDWSYDTNDLCLRLCPSTIKNGKLPSDCQRKIGNSCSFTCEGSHKSTISSSNIVCTSEGTWNENTEELCKEDAPKVEKTSLTGVYIGSSVGVVIIIVTLIAVIFCFIKRKKPPLNAYESRPVVGDNSYSTFQNDGFSPEELHDRSSTHIYSTIEEIHNTEKEIYLEPIQ